MTDTTAAHVSAWAPFKHRAYFWLWLGVVTASVGMWAQTVGAQWLFVNDPNAATIVTLVQTANTLPMMLLALPAGVLADAFDRRWLMFGVQVYFVTVATLLTILTWLGMMPPALLLTFTFAVGAGQAMMSPTWQSLIPELVPRDEVPAATRLDMVSVNVSRAAGPALAGLIIATWGVPPVFALNAACGVLLVLVLLAWRRQRSVSGERERFLPALKAGGRYVRHEPVVRTILARLAMFVVPACTVWALLPLIANHELKLGADGYGLLFAALGIGAVGGALGMGPVKRFLSSNLTLAASALVFGAALAIVVLVPNVWVALLMLVLCGFGWTATISTIISELQLFLPHWVRARAIGIYLMVFLGSNALASPLWGQLTTRIGLKTTVLVAAAMVAASALGALVLRVPDNAHLDRSPALYWGTPSFGVEPEPDSGPVVVSIEYEVEPAEQAAFLAAMADMRRSRMRSGASRWGLYRVGERPELFYEQFEVPSWREHQQQHEGRLTAEDQAIEEATFAHIVGQPRTQHLLPPETS